MHDDRNRRIGTLLIVGSAIAYSLSGYFTRLITLEVWTVLFWRGIFGGLFIGAYVVWRHRQGLRGAVQAMGMAGLWVTLLSTLATICFINALRLAPVADVMTIHAAIPFMTAVLALVFIGEREDWSTWAASFIALVGVVIIVNPQASAGYLAGYAFATTMALSYAAMMVIIRQNRHVSMLPAACLSAFLCACVVLPFAQPAQVTTTALLDLLLFGIAQSDSPARRAEPARTSRRPEQRHRLATTRRRNGAGDMVQRLRQRSLAGDGDVDRRLSRRRSPHPRAFRLARATASARGSTSSSCGRRWRGGGGRVVRA